MKPSILVEALVVGALVAAALALWPGQLSTLTDKLLAGFLIGAAFHLSFEALGWNLKYCVGKVSSAA
jgi:hypothetical protein